MGLRVFVYPFLRALQALPVERPMKAKTQHIMKASKGLTVFMKAKHHIDEMGQIVVSGLDAQQSYQTGAMGDMTCWLVHPEGAEEIPAETVVDCLPFIPNS